MISTGSEYAARSHELDAAILAVIESWQRGEPGLDDPGFDALALRLFTYQYDYNAAYGRYCNWLGTSPATVTGWRSIPPVPASAFKDATLATFDPHAAALTFATSGTTANTTGRHYFETSALYDATCTATFERFMLEGAVELRYLQLVPNPMERPDSSLGYMMKRVAGRYGDGATQWFVHDGGLDLASLASALSDATRERRPVCLATTAFALAHALDAFAAQGLRWSLEPGSRVMETGGFKGRSRSLDRNELADRCARAFGIEPAQIVSEYGMTELSSQYYDDPAGIARPLQSRRKIGPPWLRTRIVGVDQRDVPDGTAGTLVHVDLANRSSCIAIATEDLGVRFEPGNGFVLLGREGGAPLRGCSLDAETLAARVTSDSG